jgi:hypothetical protein
VKFPEQYRAEMQNMHLNAEFAGAILTSDF